MKKLGVLGAGAFGTALALAYSHKFKVCLFSWFEDHVARMRESRVNEFLSEVHIPNEIDIDVVENLECDTFDYLLWVFPLKPTISLLEPLADKLRGTTVIICSKGLMPGGELLSNTFERWLPDSKVGYLAGPNFAYDIAKGNLSASDIVFADYSDAVAVEHDLFTERLRLSPHSDLVGVQICGAMKNVIAIACGIAMGLSSSSNTHAAILTFALREMRNLGIAVGASESTFYGLCGVGDLILTAFNEASRNFSFGMRIAAGERAGDIIKSSNAVCEGYDTTENVLALAKRYSVPIPICEAVHRILFEHQDPHTIFDVF
ncbi:MAG: NAD(P)H-dependent glycerol-3-phosphate dehydrogenase [Holosporales bacterium]|jgi:glycerol-3-phosphate dehydrogenase (NAD(P)+)|nr:NAD(P)H-dependent glycerol-3-phosphate dehydrogenase [Holosporales bacterium]